MTRKTRRIFAFGSRPPDRAAEPDSEEAIALTRRLASTRPPRARREAFADELADDDATVVAPARLADDERTGARSPRLALVDEDEEGATVVAPGRLADRGARLGPGSPRTSASSAPLAGAAAPPSEGRVPRPDREPRSAGGRAGVGATVRIPTDGPTSTPEGAGPREAPISDDAPTVLGRGARSCPSCGLSFSAGDVRFCPFDGDRLVAAPSWDPCADPLVGRMIGGRYVVEGVLAEGSMGTVYRVRHERLSTSFALKVLRRELARDQDIAGRLVDEARATAAIGHPNIVAVTDFGEIGANELPDLGSLRLPYFVMELLAGESLADSLRAGPFPPRRVASIALGAAQALAAAHAAGIVHRDLKPGNIRLLTSARTETVKILDFGVAKILGSSRQTKAGMVFGTPHYMSPEQGRGHSVDHRTDVYSLGVIMYQCLTGRVPFEADTYMGIVTKHLFARAEPIVLGDDGAGMAGGLELVVMRCLEKDPANRYRSMDALVADLQAVLSEGTSTVERALSGGARLGLREKETLSPPPAAELAGAFAHRWRGRLGWVAASVAALGLFWFAWRRPGFDVSSSAPTPAPSATAQGWGQPSATEPIAETTVDSPSSVTTLSLAEDDAGPTVPRHGERPARPASTPKTRASGAAPATGTASPIPSPVTPAPPRAKPPAATTGGQGDVVDPWSKP